MDFFHSQDVARQKTSTLMLYFVLAVVAITLAVYAVALGTIGVMKSKSDPTGPAVHLIEPSILIPSLLGVLGLVTLGSLYKTTQLGGGGRVVAEELGGRLLNPGSATPAERRLLNVVEEMAIASGTPVPPVYLLDHEESINAFAAGHAPADAVIGVTRGTMERLSRDELQGVIAHEFSHILNGDMRLNLRLIGLLHGILILAITGYWLMRIFGNSSSSDDKKNSGAALALLGLGVMVVGYVGLFFGRLIKAGVSRQREYLADASAVQFTRNPDGIAGALKKIGGLEAGSTVKAPAAEEASHMFFGAGVAATLDGMFATHPPLEERIRRIDPNFKGQFPSQPAVASNFDDEEQYAASNLASRKRPPSATAVEAAAASTALSSVGDPQQKHVDYAQEVLNSLPKPLVDAAREPFSARGVVIALLLADNHKERTLAFERWQGLANNLLVGETKKLLPIAIETPQQFWLPLLETTYPALCRMTPSQLSSFRKDVDALIAADQKLSLFEFTVLQTLIRRLSQRTKPQQAGSIGDLEAVRLQVEVLLGALAFAGDEGAGKASFAFDVGMTRIGAKATLPTQDACNLVEVGKAIERLTAATPPLKRRILDACAACIGADGRTTIEEAELFRAIGDSLDCPVPPMLAS